MGAQSRRERLPIARVRRCADELPEELGAADSVPGSEGLRAPRAPLAVRARPYASLDTVTVVKNTASVPLEHFMAHPSCLCRKTSVRSRERSEAHSSACPLRRDGDKREQMERLFVAVQVTSSL